MEVLTDLTKITSSEIFSIENRERKRDADAQKHFEHAIECLLKELWLGTAIHPEYEVGIHRRSNWYSETLQYRDPNLNYRQSIAAYKAMEEAGHISVSKDGYYDPDTGRGDITKVIATDKLFKVLESLKGNPFRVIKPNLDAECILLCNRIDGKRALVSYEDDNTTNEMRENLININKCLARHYPDLRITNDNYKELQERLRLDKDKSPIDFSKRILKRIFLNGRFDHGGRFYRAWWHNVPSEYRKYISIDGKRTCEYDYSQLNPHMVYFLVDKDMGKEDAYGELGELEEEMRKSFHGHFKKDIQVKEEIGVMLPSSFDDKEWDELSFQEQVNGPAEYSQWEDRNPR